MSIPKFLFVAINLIVVSPSLLAQYITVPANDQIKFADNGEIRSLDDAHRILFRRSENIFEVREFGRIVFSPGATSGTETAKMVISDNGNVGIGTASPESKLDIKTTQALDGIRIIHNDQAFLNIQSTSLGQSAYNNITQAGDAGIIYGSRSGIGTVNFGFVITPWANAESGVRIDGSGNVGIGAHDTKGYKLAVNGNAIFTKVVVKSYTNWPDYVFHANYRLRPLSEVEQYIKQYGHLPEVPSAAEFEKNGIDVGDNQATLLKKIEELTLYVIEQNKKIQALEADVKSMKGKRK